MPDRPKLARPMLKLVAPLTLLAPAAAVAVMVAAPEAVRLAGSICTEATPASLVSAAPEAGVILTCPAGVATKFTTVRATALPVLSNTVAVANAGEPRLMLVRAAPETGSLRATLNCC